MTAQLTSNQKVLDFVKRAGALINTAEKRASHWAQKEAAVKALIPDVVEALISSGRISEHLRDKAAQHLTDHVKALELLASVATYKTDAERAHLGEPVSSTKTASSKRIGDHSPFVGHVVSEDERPSSQGLMEAILGNR